jgi:hypothetical protein
MSERLSWPPILERAVGIIEAHDITMTLRQVFYRLVAEVVLPNRTNAYNRLARLSAKARRDGWFPRLLDQGRRIERPLYFAGPDAARAWLVDHYRLDRTAGQPWSVYVGAEKATLLPQLEEWFDDRGIPVFSLRGYSGQELVTDVTNDIMVSRRPSVLLYAGDFDPSGQDIDRDFVRRVGCFDKVERIALTADQLEGLPVQLGKADDPRSAGFIAEHGRLVQVELEALDPTDLHAMYEAALADYWDPVAFGHVLGDEDRDRGQLDA